MNPSMPLLSTSQVMLAVFKREIALGLRQKGEVLTPLVFSWSWPACSAGRGRRNQIVVAHGARCPVGQCPTGGDAVAATHVCDRSRRWLAGTNGVITHPAGSTRGIQSIGAFVMSGLPLVFVAPILGLQFGLDGRGLGILMLSLLLGTPT